MLSPVLHPLTFFSFVVTCITMSSAVLYPFPLTSIVLFTFLHYYCSLYWLLLGLLRSLVSPCEPLQWSIDCFSHHSEMRKCGASKQAWQPSDGCLFSYPKRPVGTGKVNKALYNYLPPFPLKKWELERGIAYFPRTSLEMSLQPSGEIHRKFLSNLHMYKS